MNYNIKLELNDLIEESNDFDNLKVKLKKKNPRYIYKR